LIPHGYDKFFFIISWSGSPGSYESLTGKTDDYLEPETFSTPCLELPSDSKQRPISTVVSEEDIVTDEVPK